MDLSNIIDRNTIGGWVGMFSQGGETDAPTTKGKVKGFKLDPQMMMDTLMGTHDPVMVGEKGPELMMAPKGSVVVPIKQGVKQKDIKPDEKKAGAKGYEDGGMIDPGFANNSNLANLATAPAGGGLGDPHAMLNFLGGLAKFGTAISPEGTPGDRVGQAATGMVNDAQGRVTQQQKAATMESDLGSLANPAAPPTAAPAVGSAPTVTPAGAPSAPVASAQMGPDQQKAQLNNMLFQMFQHINGGGLQGGFNQGTAPSSPSVPFRVGELSPEEALATFNAGMGARKQNEASADRPFQRMKEQAQTAMDLSKSMQELNATPKRETVVSEIPQSDGSKLWQLRDKSTGEVITSAAGAAPPPNWDKVENIDDGTGVPKTVMFDKANAKHTMVFPQWVAPKNTEAADTANEKEQIIAAKTLRDETEFKLADMQKQLGAQANKDAKGRELPQVFNPNFVAPEPDASGLSIVGGKTVWGSAAAQRKAQQITAYQKALATLKTQDDAYMSMLQKGAKGVKNPIQPTTAPLTKPDVSKPPVPAPTFTSDMHQSFVQRAVAERGDTPDQAEAKWQALLQTRTAKGQ